MEAIAAEARRAGISVVMLSDHDRLSAGSGWRDGVLVLGGQELSPRHNHLLAWGQARPLPRLKGDGVNGDPLRSLAQADERGAWVALAHPLDPAMPLVAGSRSFVCLDFRAVAAPGLELWNCLSAFKQDLARPWHGLARLFWPRAFLAGPHPLLLALWDSVGRRRAWPAFGGGDAHGFKTGRRWLPVRVFSYRRHMRLILTGLWLARPFTGRAEEDQALVLDALAAGRAFAALGPAAGFACRLEDGQGQTWPPGAELAWRPGLRLIASLPRRGRLRLVHQGRLAHEGRGREFAWPLTAPGVWRVEARAWRFPAGWRPWIYCNPFYLRGEADLG